MATKAVAKNLDMGKQQIEEIHSFAEVMVEAQQYGLKQADVTVIANPYETMNKDKDELIGRPFMIRAVKFQTDKATNQNYVNLWVIRDDDRLFRVTDGSTGIYAQMDDLVAARIENDHPTPYNFFLIPNGLRKSEYGIDENGNAVDLDDEDAVIVSKAATYYLA